MLGQKLYIGGIQLSIIKLAIRRGRGPSKCKRMRTGGRRLCQYERSQIFFNIVPCPEATCVY